MVDKYQDPHDANRFVYVGRNGDRAYLEKPEGYMHRVRFALSSGEVFEEVYITAETAEEQILRELGGGSIQIREGAYQPEATRQPPARKLAPRRAAPHRPPRAPTSRRVPEPETTPETPEPPEPKPPRSGQTFERLVEDLEQPLPENMSEEQRRIYEENNLLKDMPDVGFDFRRFLRLELDDPSPGEP